MQGLQQDWEPQEEQDLAEEQPTALGNRAGLTMGSFCLLTGPDHHTQHWLCPAELLMCIGFCPMCYMHTRHVGLRTSCKTGTQSSPAACLCVEMITLCKYWNKIKHIPRSNISNFCSGIFECVN